MSLDKAAAQPEYVGPSPEFTDSICYPECKIPLGSELAGSLSLQEGAKHGSVAPAGSSSRKRINRSRNDAEVGVCGEGESFGVGEGGGGGRCGEGGVGTAPILHC